MNTPTRNELIDFLEGISTIDGVSFGERHPVHAGLFWWRKFLTILDRANTPDSAAQGAMGEAVGEVVNVGPGKDDMEVELYSPLPHGTLLYQVAQPSDATAQLSVYGDVHAGAKRITEKELADPDYMRHYVSSLYETIDDILATQPRVDLTDERVAFEIVRAALPKFSLVEGDWLIRAVKVGPYQDVEEAEAIHIDTINTIIRALLSNTAQGKTEHFDKHDQAYHQALDEGRERMAEQWAKDRKAKDNGRG